MAELMQAEVTAERLEEPLHRPLGGQRWLGSLDGFSMVEHLLVGAPGVNADGTKVPSAWPRAPRTGRRASTRDR